MLTIFPHNILITFAADVQRSALHITLQAIRSLSCFFKWIKGRLHVKSFYGTSQNAVYTQIWIAVCTYLFLIIAKKEFHIECELYILAQSIGLVLFEKEPINEIFKRNSNNKNVQNDGQLWLWPDFSGQ